MTSKTMRITMAISSHSARLPDASSKRAVYVSFDRELAVHCGAHRFHAEGVDRHGVNAGEIHVLGDLEGVVDALR